MKKVKPSKKISDSFLWGEVSIKYHVIQKSHQSGHQFRSGPKHDEFGLFAILSSLVCAESAYPLINRGSIIWCCGHMDLGF